MRGREGEEWRGREEGKGRGGGRRGRGGEGGACELKRVEGKIEVGRGKDGMPGAKLKLVEKEGD